ncbi:hypothetical protein K1T71_009306 [Dendrolimus kikuchii]|uniref:Uncharacterized protein n=1 Tax=Dendrolimus kikuchii TaxID=765133 RepID=A0ACC1CUF9_9NEOP|nr:hypothetical protein K1T71_009306 [Dendrolimus kikuchii]
MLAPGTEILIGQNLTELPNIRVIKTDTELLLYSTSEQSLIDIKTSEEITGQGVLAVRVGCNNRLTQYVYVASDACMKPDAEYLILPGIYKFQDGYATIILLKEVKYGNLNYLLDEGPSSIRRWPKLYEHNLCSSTGITDNKIVFYTAVFVIKCALFVIEVECRFEWSNTSCRSVRNNAITCKLARAGCGWLPGNGHDVVQYS